MKTTNYYNTFIEVAEDCPVEEAEIPPQKSNVKTVANIQFELMSNNPYKHTSDDVVFSLYAIKNTISKENLAQKREEFYSKGQACLRSSPLAKRYGWGIHHDEKGRVAIYPVESDEYNSLREEKDIKHVKAMRSKRSNKAKKNPEV